MTDKLQALYDGLKDSYNLGSIDEFRTKMEDETKRKTFYDAVSPHYNLGDYDSFNSKLGYGNTNAVEKAEDANQRMVDAVTPTPESTPAPAPAPAPAMKADDSYLTDEDKQEIAENSKMSWKEAKKLGQQAYGIAGQRPTADSASKASEFIDANRESASQYEETEKKNQERKIEEAKPIAQAYDEVAEGMRENAKAMREASKQMERDYYALTKAAADYATEKYGPMPKKLSSKEGWGKAYEEYLKNNDPNNIIGQYNNQAERSKRNDYISFTEHMANQTERRAKQTMREAERGVVGNTVGGIGYGVSQPSSWSMGLSDLWTAEHILPLANKLKRGEPLNEYEQAALDAYGTYEEAANILREYDTRGFKAGQTTGEMLPFMAQMALNPAGGMGESMAKEGVRKAVAKTAGDAVADVAMKEYGTMATKDLLKRYGVDGMMARLPIAVRRMGGDLAASAVLANTLQAGSTFNDVVERKYGAPVQDGEHYTFDPEQEKSWAEAAYKGELSSIIENFTEMMGEWRVLGLADKMSKFGSDQVGRIVRAMGDSDFAKGLGNVLRDAHWSGVIGETLEEEYGILLNSLLTGDNKFSDLWDLDQQIDIMLGVGLFGGLVGGAKMAAYPAEYINRKKHLEEVTDACREWKGPEWDQIQERIDNADNDGLRAIAASAIAEGGEEQRNILLYIDALQRMRGITIARDLLPGDEDTKTMQEFYLNGYDGADMKAIQSAFEHKRGQLQQMGDNALLIADTDGLYATDEDGKQIFQGPIREMVRDYLNAKAAYYGMNDGIDDRAQRRAKAAELMVRSNDNNGRQVEATLRDGEKVHIISGEVGMTDNAPDMAHSSASIVIRREDGSKEMISPALIKSIDNVQNTEEVATLAAQRAEEESRNEDLAELEQSDPIVDLQTMADIENAENSGKAGATYVKDAVVTLPDGTTGIINMTPDQTDDHMVEVVWSNPNGRPTVEHISAQDLYDLEHPAVTASEIAQDEQVQNTEDEVRLSAEEQAYNDWTAKHGENSLNKLNQTRAYAEEKLSEQESQLAEVNQELADLPDIQDEEIVKKQNDLEKRKAELEQSIANYQAVLGQMNSIQSVYDAQNGVAEQVPTAGEKVAPAKEDGTGVRFSLTPEEQRRMDILLKRQQRRKLTAKEQTELEELTNQVYENTITDEVRQAAKERVDELNKASMERMLTDEERNEYLRMTDLAYDAHTAPGKLGEAIKRLQTITAEIVALEDKAENEGLSDEEKKTLNRLQRDYLMAEQAFVTDADIEDAQKLMDEYQKNTGVKMRLISDITKASEEDIEKALKGGRSWITGDNEVVFLLPKIKHTGTDLGRMYRHEVLSHYNLKNSMSKDDWNQFLDEVWAVMPEDQRKRLDKTYAQHYKKGHTDEEYHRLLADEFIATNAEKLFTKASEYRTIGQKIIDAVTNWIRGDKKTDTPMDTPILPEFIEKKLRDVYGKKIDKQSDSKSEDTRNSVAYHGSGADFDKFDHSFMSTGEGSQVYGWGTYVSTNEDTSKVYANISGIPTVTYKGEKAPTYYGQELADMMAQSMWQNGKTFEQAKQETIDALNSFAEKDKEHNYTKEIDFITNLKEDDFERKDTDGRYLYTVEIPDDNGENYLHWDKPITDSQSDKIVNALLAMPEVVAEYGEDAEREVKSSLGHGTYGKNIEGALNYFLGDEKNYATDEDPGAERNSKFLNSLGFVGMQVAVDRRGGKRYDGDNYVIYNPDDIQIKDKTRFSIQDEETNDVFNRAIEEYGTTEDSNLAGYMLTDGRYLDFSEGSGMRTLDHRNVGMAYEDTVDEKYKYMYDFMKRGAIRIMPEGGGFELAVAPTFEQKRTLRQFIAERGGDVYVDFLNPDGGNPISAEYYEAEPSRVLADIDRYFNEGVKPISDVRYSIIDEANAKQKLPGKIYDIDDAEAETRYSLTKNTRQTIQAWMQQRDDLDVMEKTNILNYIGNELDGTTLQLAAGRWFAKGTVRFPEDDDKIKQAVEVAKKAKVDPLQYDSPMEVINTHADIEIKGKPINPDKVSTLHKAQELPEGIVIYDVDESEESRENMRQIINTHFGKESSPWCLLQGDGKGYLTEDSKRYWEYYNAYPKQVAFKNGKLVAFSANSTQDRIWWDRQDKALEGIPNGERTLEDGRKKAEMMMPDGTNKAYGYVYRGNKQNGLYEEWYGNGNIKRKENYKDGHLEGLREFWYENGNLRKVANYVDGKPDGLSISGYENGLMASRWNYSNGQVDGECEDWYEDGQMSGRSFWKNGKPDGRETEWNTSGKMIVNSYWSDGELVKQMPLTKEKGTPAPMLGDMAAEEVYEENVTPRFSLVVDPELYDQLESGEKEKGYRNVTLNEDGTLGSPMAGRLGRANAGSVATSSFGLGAWEQSEENPDMADENGKINLIKPEDKGEVRGVNYNPYIHIRPTAVNKQFTQAWNRPELVYIETEYPTSELTSGYKAEKANLPVGRHKWSNGDLILSRYDKPMRIVPWEEVADQWVKEFKKSGVTFDIVPPALLPILAERGVTILPPKKAAQQPAMEAYNQWKAEQTGMPDYITDERDGEMISEETPDNTTRFSLSTWENGGREDFIAFVDSQIAAGVLPEDAREAFVGKMDETYKQAKKIYDSGDFETFNEWSDLEVARDSAGNSIYTVIKPNNEYGMNLDFSLVCKKRRTLNAVLNEMIDRDLIKYLGSADGDLSIARINELIRNYGFETACRLCFVDAKRFRQVKVADDFVQLYNGLVNKLIPRGSKVKATFFDFARTGRYTDTDQPLNQMSDDQLNISALQKVVDTEDKKKGDEPGRTVTYKIAKHLLENPQDRQYVQREDFMSTRGFGNVKAENRAVLGLYNAKKGSGGPKVTEGDVQYLGDVAKAGWSPEEAFKVGGVRIQSFSDYVPHMVFDYIQMVADLAAGKFPAHAYTKEELFAKMFGRTGIKINLSLVPAVAEDGVAPGLDKDGNYVWQENETFPFGEAIAVQNAEGYRENCGTIAVGVSDEQILKMLADEDIRMVIPYHKSGLNKKIAVYNNIDKFTDYTKSQNTRYKDGKKLSKSDAADEPNFNELLQREGDPNAAAQAYLDWCTYHDYLPKFDQFAYDDKGNMRQGYYKLLEDFTTYVPNAEGGHDFYPQRAITLTLPKEGDAFGSSTDIMRRGMQEDEELTRRQEAMVKPIVDEIQKMLTGEKPQTMLSVAENSPYDGISSQELFATLWSEENGYDYDKVTELAERVIDGRAELAYIKPQFRKAVRTIPQAAIAIISRRATEADVPAISTLEDTERAVEEWADKEGYFIDSSRLKEIVDGEAFTSGSEATVYLDNTGEYVIKVYAETDLPSNVWKSNEIINFNAAVPGSEEDVIGITDDRFGNLHIVTQQKYIPGNTLNNSGKKFSDIRDQLAAKYRFNPYTNANEYFTYTDLNDKNIIIDEVTGEPTIIDCFINDDGVKSGAFLPKVKETVVDAQTFVTPEQDAEYRKAYEDGDVKKAEQMVKDAFKAKFPNTKVLDENGEPLVMYHGTPYAYVMGRYDGARPFYTFDKSKTGKNTESGDAKAGFFFTPDEDFARYFEIHREYNPITGTTKESGFGGGNLYRLFLNMEKPLDLRDLSTDEARTVHSLLPEYRQRDWDVDEVKRMSKTKGESKKLQEILAKSVEKEGEYDGIINYVADNNKRKNVEYCVFNPTQIKSAEPFTFDDNGELIPLSERFNRYNDDVRYSAIGEVGAAHDTTSDGLERLRNLEVARQMESELNPDWNAQDDENALKIKVATGWERGGDGKWRYEMPDAKLKDGALERKWGGKTTLADIVDAPELFRVYPALKDIKVKRETRSGRDGRYDHGNNMMYIGTGDYTYLLNRIKKYGEDAGFMPGYAQERVKEMIDDINSTLAHELQHAIQAQENFAKGGSPNMLKPGYDRSQLDQLRDDVNSLVVRYNNMTPLERSLNYSMRGEIERRRRAFKRELGNAVLGYQGYRSLGGEVEARNVSRRRNMTDEERRNTLLASTEDVARPDQLYIHRAVEDIPAEESVRFSIANENQRIFISNAERAVEKIQQDKATPDQWLAMLTKNGGIKAGEDKWLGLSQWLKGLDGKVSKNQIQEFIAENGIKIEEEKYFENIDLYDETLKDALNRIVRKEDLDELQEEVDADANSADRYDRLGEDADSADLDEYLMEVMTERYGDDFGVAFTIEDGEVLFNIGPYEIDAESYNKEIAGPNNKAIDAIRLGYTAEGLENKREIALTIPTIEPWMTDDIIHFGDAGEGRAIAWIRFGDTKYSPEYVEGDKAMGDFYGNLQHKYGEFWRDKMTKKEKEQEEEIIKRYMHSTDGAERVLFIDEIQSNRHQEGREKGYKVVPSTWTARKVGENWQILDGEEILGRVMHHKGDTEESVLGAYFDLHNQGAVPPAPFEKNWAELSMKRMLRLAAEEGYDKLAWTPGQQQTDRYNLGEYISSVRSSDWQDMSDTFGEDENDATYKDVKDVSIPERGIEFIVDREGKVLTDVNDQFTGRNLSELFGKDVAVKLLTHGEQFINRAQLRPTDSNGMSTFYDQMLVNFMNKYGKQWGVKVQDIVLPGVEDGEYTSHSVDITPEMRKDVMEGQTMFSIADDITNTKAFKEWFGDSKVVDKNGNPLVVYHGSHNRFNVFRYNPDDIGFHFGNKTTARNRVGRRKDSYLMPVYLRITNPIEFDTDLGAWDSDYLAKALYKKGILNEQEARSILFTPEGYKRNQTLANIDLRKMLKDKGYDGIIYNNYFESNGSKSYLVFDRSQIKSATDNNGEFSPTNPDIRYSFVGERAASTLKTFSNEWIMMSDLNNAKAMERLGRSKEWIKSTTGWERGADGKWRYEMEDLELNDNFFEANTIGDAVKKSRLLTAYPKLKDAKVEFAKKEVATQSFLDGDRFYIEYTDEKSASEALAHEIQHYIQEKEGFAEGSNPSEFTDDKKRLEVLDMSSDEIEEIMAKANVAWDVDDDATLDDISKALDESKVGSSEHKAYNDIYTLAASGYTVKQAKDKLIEESRNITNELVGMYSDPNSPLRKYKRVAGEVEARNVERRMNMSLADRLATLASATEDVAREDQIIILNGAVQEFKEENDPIMAPLNTLTDTRYSIHIEPSNIRSEYDNGLVKVYNPRDIADIQAAVMREAYTHNDIRNLNGWDQFMDAAYRMGSNDIVSRAMRNGFDFGEATEQWAFENAERMVAPFEKMMSQNGIDLRYSVSGDEIRMYLIRRNGLLDDIDLMVMREDLPVEPSVRFSTTGSPSARDLYDASQQSTLNNLYRAYIDYSKPLRDFQAIIAEESGTPIKDYENAWEAENQRSSKSKAEIEKYEITYFEPMRDAVKALQERAGITYEEVLRYLIAKHGLERNVVLAQRDAEAEYKKYKQENPNGTKTVDDFFNKNRERDYSGLTTLSGKDDVAEAEDFARDLVATIESAAQTETSELWDAISSAVKAIQKKRYESGLISKSQMDHEADMFNNYIPLRGFAETIAEDVYDYYEDTQRNRPQRDKKAKGRTSLADDPLATIGAMAASAITLGNKNLVKQRFLNMVENHPTDLATVKDVWVVNVGTPTDPIWEPEYPDIHDGMTADEIDQELKDYDLRMDALQNMGMAKKATNKLDIKWRTLGQQAQQHIITVRRGGKEQMIIINGNPQVARTVNGVNNPDAQLSDFMRGVRAVQRFMAANFTTRNPAFVVSNLLRDVGFAVMATAAKEDVAYKRKFMKNISRSLVTITNMGKLIKKWQNGTLDDSHDIERYFGEFMDYGGETGYTAENTVDAYRKKMIQGLKNKNALQRGGEAVLDFFELCNRSVEDMTRFTTYMTSRQMGRSVQRSVADAKNITVNFNRKGSGEMCQKYVASAFLFLNAGIQSLQNIAKISGIEFGLDADGKKIKVNVNGKKLGKSMAVLFGSQIMLGMLIPMLNEVMMGLAGGDDDDKPVTDEEGVVIETNPYRRLTEFERRNNICLWLGGDNFVKIPIAIELRAFYGLGETMYGMMAGIPNPNPGADVVDQMLDLLPVNFIESGGLVPDAVAPLWESFISNKNYQGMPIYNDSEFLENAPEASKVYSNTGDAYIAISRFINELGGGDEVSKSKLDTRLTNPAIMQHIVEGYLGGLLTTSRQTAKLIGQPVKEFILGQEVEPIPARDWPIVNRLYINTDKRNDDRYIKERYYFYRNQAEKIRHDERGYLERLDDPKYEQKYNELIESPEYMDYIAFGALNQAVKDAHNVVKELGSEYKEFEVDAMRNLVNALDEETNGIINPQGWGESIRGKDKNIGE